MPTPHPKYDPDELQVEIDRYFVKNTERPTISGLAGFLGFADRSSMYDYQKREETSYIIKKAINRIESIHEERLYDSQPTGSIFWLKNRGWSDRPQIDPNDAAYEMFTDWLNHVKNVRTEPEADSGD